MTGQIRARVLRAISANRTPGFHFAGHFFGVAFERIAAEGARLSLAGGAHVEDADGSVNLGVVAMLADIALASSIRAALGSGSTRLATVSMSLQLTGAPLRGRLEAEGHSQGFTEHAAARQGLARFSVSAGGRVACFGTGAFMPLAPPAGTTMHPVVREFAPEPPALDEASLDTRERAILARADEALARASPAHAFIGHFLGYHAKRSDRGATATMPTGVHVGNRVDHVQGGILVGLGAATAAAALPATWKLSAISAWFVSPGEGDELQAQATVWHHGRDTAVVRTEVAIAGGRRVLEMVSAHARSPAGG
jgi:acyl-coenzyme A thioesterase PaaI-like protein